MEESEKEQAPHQHLKTGLYCTLVLAFWAWFAWNLHTHSKQREQETPPMTASTTDSLAATAQPRYEIF